MSRKDVRKAAEEAICCGVLSEVYEDKRLKDYYAKKAEKARRNYQWLLAARKEHR